MPRETYINLYRQLHGCNPEFWRLNCLSADEIKNEITYMREELAAELNKLVRLGAGDWTTAKRWMRQTHQSA